MGHGLQAIAPAFTYIFRGGLILGAAAILFFIAREFSGLRGFARRARPVKLDAPQSDWRPVTMPINTLMNPGLPPLTRHSASVARRWFRCAMTPWMMAAPKR